MQLTEFSELLTETNIYIKNGKRLYIVPKFLDVYSTKGFNEQNLRKAMIELPDELDVSTENFLYNIEADRLLHS